MSDYRQSKHRVLAFIALTALITVSSWGALLWIYGRAPLDDLITKPPALLLIYIGAAGPSIAAILLTLRNAGRSGLNQLFRQSFQIGFNLRACLLTVMLPLSLPLLTALVTVLLLVSFTDSLGSVQMPAWYAIIPPAALVVFFAGPLCEELGWRGYMQPLLLTTYTPAVSAIIIGTVWCFWHIPLSLTPGTTPVLSSPTAWLVYWLDTVLISVMMLVIVVQAGGSVVAAMLLHWMSNIAVSHILAPMFPHATDTVWQQFDYIHAGVLLVVATLLLLQHPRRSNQHVN